MTATPIPKKTPRQRWMAVLSRAGAEEIAAGLDRAGARPAHRRLRGPETGLVMVRGRIGGGGDPFNLGEMTATRCTVRTECGHTGHAYVAGRDARQAELAALADALLQDPERRDTLLRTMVAPLADAQQAAARTIARKAAATQVKFFTLATMRS